MPQPITQCADCEGGELCHHPACKPAEVHSVRWGWCGRDPGNLALFHDKAQADAFAEWIEITRFVQTMRETITIGGPQYREFAVHLMRQAEPAEHLGVEL